jgi:anaerobic selenocysteine-containing dehydrogenase
MQATVTTDPCVSRTPLPLDARDLPTVCVLCSHNCGLRVDVEGGRIASVRADADNPITRGYICNKGVTIDRYVHHDERLTHPLRRREDGSFERIDWKTAIDEIACRLGKLRETHGPRSIALVGIGGQGNHMDAGFGLPFLAALGSRRWFNAFGQEKTQHALVDQWIADAPPGTFLHPDIEGADVLLVLGTNPRISNRGHNPTETFKALAKNPGKKVIVADPRDTETTREASVHLRIRAGSDAWLLAGMAASIVQNELHDFEFLGTGTTGFSELRDILTRIDVADMAGRTGISAEELHATAREFATADAAAIMYDLGVEQTRFSTLVSWLIRINLILTGQYGVAGGDVFVEGFAPPERRPEGAPEPERALASGIRAIQALGSLGMFSPTLVPEEIRLEHPERIRALIVEGCNPYLSYSDTKAWKEARGRLDLMVVIDPAMTETARDADYILPTPTGYEKWELALFPKNFPEIQTQVRPPLVAPPGEALPEPEIYVRLAEAMGIVAPPPRHLRGLGRLASSAAGRGLFMLAALRAARRAASAGFDEEAQLVYWLYRLVGPHFPAPSLVAVWGLAHRNAMGRREAVLRTLGEGWRRRSSFALGEELFRRILAHPEGVEIARLEPERNLEQNLGWADGKLRVATPEMLGELERALETVDEPDADYPFVLGNGLRTRWTANTIQRDPGWRKGRGPHCTLHLSTGDAARLDIGNGDPVEVETPRGSFILPAEIDAKVADGYVWFPNGFGMERVSKENGGAFDAGVNMNAITDSADRDPFTGCPHHRFVRCNLRKSEARAA